MPEHLRSIKHNQSHYTATETANQHNCNHSSVLYPYSEDKYRGKKIGRAPTPVEFIIRTTPPIAIFGFSIQIVSPLSKFFNFSLPLPSRSCTWPFTTTTPINPPINTHTTALHINPIYPIFGII